MILYRIAREKYAADLSGRGGLLSSARWHDHLPVIYTSFNSATCILEKLVHLLPEEIHHDLMMCMISVDESLASEIIEIEQLPSNWKHYPAPEILKRIGNAWLTAKSSPLLFVPSVIDPYSQNVLINPLHPGAARITVEKMEPFTYDERLTVHWKKK
ncbi:RES family NAD+ phosphorylase [Mucilaginibacter gotjawali]|uniref:RES domain-containing protein n=2 Tax=Mucilaginibacter gotjawali TaxID=1550579 RepID=A0A839SQ53_9SPHI|nr:RES family NAD+ phosphorylase [Mucilaginibacter gotjawali]MBB3058599.1 RES domain-containing protein [Mucilaginibacter gotjawali]BAU52434.1 RES domain protein [Mucilaginibacter gotjawali]